VALARGRGDSGGQICGCGVEEGGRGGGGSWRGRACGWVGLYAEEVDCVARGFFADVGALGVGEPGEGFGDVDAADVGGGALGGG